jgi:PPK2 family polyphosphate:nucleotide phosphotransferase
VKSAAETARVTVQSRPVARP